MFKSILGKLIARGLSIILSSLFAIAMAFFGPTGCSLTPNIYKMPGDELEEIRSSVGSIGVTISSYPVKQKIVKPAKGVIGGARRGIAFGAAAPVAIGFVSPVPGGTILGLIVAPFTAVAGGVYGTTKGVPVQDVEKAEAAGLQAIERLKYMNLRQVLGEEIVNLGNEKTGIAFVNLPETGPGDPKEVVRYDQMALPDIDMVLELRAEKGGLWGLYSFDPPSTVYVEVKVRLIRARDNQVFISETFYCDSAEERTYLQWAENEGQLLVDEFVRCVPKIAEKVIDDLFRVYPIPWQ